MRMLASDSLDGTIPVWPSCRFKALQHWMPSPPRPHYRFLPRRLEVAVFAADRRVRVWSLASGAMTVELLEGVGPFGHLDNPSNSSQLPSSDPPDLPRWIVTLFGRLDTISWNNLANPLPFPERVLSARLGWHGYLHLCRARGIEGGRLRLPYA